MVGASIYSGNPLIGIWVEQYVRSLPKWRRILSKLPIQKYKITKEEFEEWLSNKTFETN